MLLALLYEADGKLSAAAPACDQEPLGNRYWREIHPEKVNLRDSETAYVDIGNSWLVDRLLKMDFEDGIDVAEIVDTYLGRSTAAHR